MELISIIKNVNSRYDGDLIYYYKKVMRAPNAYAHYHNIRHMLHVLWEAYDGGVHMGLNKEELRELLIAAMYHDYGHSGKKLPEGDKTNISIAIESLRADILEYDKKSLYKIERMISATEFPYLFETYDLPSQILRDADMSQTFSPVWIQSILFDLGAELEMSYEDMLKMQLPFMENQKFYTSWGRTKFEPEKSKRIEVVTEMISLL